MAQKEAFEKSIILIGPIGVGKSITAQSLQDKTGLPVITLDMMRYCDRDIQKLIDERDIVFNEIEIVKQELNLTNNFNKIELNNKLRKLNSALYRLNSSIQSRQLFPNLPNYFDMGYNRNLNDEIKSKYGLYAWHFYNKKFEIKLLQALHTQINTPCIIDCGGSMPISLMSKYKQFKIRQFFPNFDNKLTFDLETKGLEFFQLKNIFQDFKNVVYLELPKDYKLSMQKAKNNLLNDLFLKSNQYEKLSTLKIQTIDLIDGSKLNMEVLDNITNQIIKETNTSTKMKNVRLLENERYN